MEIKEVVAPIFTESGKRAGLALIATAGLLSVLCSIILLSYLLFGIVGRRSSSGSKWFQFGWSKFVQTPLRKYLVSFVFADLLQGTAFCLNYRWAMIGHMNDNGVCLFQGSISQVGDLGATIWSNIIAFQTCMMLLAPHNRPSTQFEICVLIAVWSIVLLLPILGSTVIQNSRNGSFWGLSGAWCWISDGYQVSRLLFLYAWVFFNLFTSFCLYGIVYLKITGVVEYRRDTIFKLKWVRPNQGRANGTSIWIKIRDFWRGEDGENQQSRIESPASPSLANKDNIRTARLLMLYPIGYGFVVTPIAVCRMGVLAGWTPPFWLYTLAGTCLASSGLTNASIYFVTRYPSIRRNMSWSAGITATPHFQVNIDNVGIPMTLLAQRSPQPHPVLHIGPVKYSPFRAEDDAISERDRATGSATDLALKDGSDSDIDPAESGQAKRHWRFDDDSFDFPSNKSNHQP